VDKRETKLVITLKKLSYKDRLEHLDLVTLKYRRLRVDMTEVYRIVTNKYMKAPFHRFYNLTVMPQSPVLCLHITAPALHRKWGFCPILFKIKKLKVAQK